MPSYYRHVQGNLNVGDIAKSSDIHHIQTHIKDSEQALLSDLHNGESYVLGIENEYKNSFVLTAANKMGNRYVDSYNTFDERTDFININRNDVRQPIPKTKTSVYSISTILKNTSNKPIPVTFELQDEMEETLRTNTITIPANTTSTEPVEIVFDLDYYPTPPNLDYETLIKRDGKDIPPKTKEGSFDEGYSEAHAEEKSYYSCGVSKLYFVIKRTNLNAIDLLESKDDEVIFDAENSLGVYCNSKSEFPDKGMYAEIKSGKDYVDSGKNIWYKDIYANKLTYLCSGGQAIINGEKVQCIDTHVSVDTGSSFGNVLTQVYLGEDGHLHTAQKKASFTTNINEFEDDINQPIPKGALLVGLILTYSNALYGISKEPLIIQEGYGQLPRSHHERLRRLEKQMNWSNDLALPSRIKYVYNSEELVDEEGEKLLKLLPYSSESSTDIDNLSSDNIFLTTDENGNFVVKLSDSVTQTIPVTLKEELKKSDGKEIELAETDVLNVSSFSKIEHMVHNSEEGTLKLDNIRAEDNTTGIATTDEEAKLTEYNPWDDSAENRPTGDKYEKTEREYTVVSGKNGKKDKQSSYPGVTFYTDTNYSFKKLTIPIHKFKNCTSIKFFIWKRQDENNKKNVVPYFKKKQLIYTSKDFSLEKAVVKEDYQYMDDGFTIDFEETDKKGLSLKKGQYVIVCVPTPKSGEGSLFVETYKPENSKDFCIRYMGAANASHFDYQEAYQEIWYNSASAIVSQENFYETGSVESKTLVWTEQGLERIKTVNPIIDNNLTIGNDTKDSYELYVDTGGGWVQVTPNQENEINNGGATTFKWKLVFNGGGKSTPELKYNDEKGYAIKFILARDRAASFMQSDNAVDFNKNMCITSKAFDGDDILKQYIGDMNFGTEHSRFEGYEFARVWADKAMNKKLSIDIQASDKKIDYKSSPVDIWSLHYCDLTLNDFEQIDVDYNDYDSQLEYDENNMRLKLDSEHSYNDDDIQVKELFEFTKQVNDIDSSEEEDMTFTNNDGVSKNQLFMKKTFENSIDLTKYTGLKFKFNTTTKASTSMILRGLGIYISSIKEKEVPSNITNLPDGFENDPEGNNILEDTSIIPSVIDPDVSSASYYEGQIIKIIHKYDPKNDGNKIYPEGFYEYKKVYDNEKRKYVWKLQQVLDVRTYSIYEIGDIISSDEDNSFEVRIELDQNSNNLKHVKEIGIITLNDEKDKYEVEENFVQTKLSTREDNGKIIVTLQDKDENPIEDEYIYWGENDANSKKTDVNGQIDVPVSSNTGSFIFSFKGSIIKKENEDGEEEKIVRAKSSITTDYDFSGEEKIITDSNPEIISASEIQLSLESVRAISEEVLKIYDPTDTSVSFNSPKGNAIDDKPITIYPYDKITLNTSTYALTAGSTQLDTITYTEPYTTQINIKHKDGSLYDESVICYINNPFQGTLTDYKHLGIQLAADVYLPKDSIKINICSQPNGINPIASVNVPTLNSIYYPNTAQRNINLSQIFKKFDIGEEKIKSISISVTPYFQYFMDKILVDDEGNNSKPSINLFLGKIVLYRARTIPIYHNKMRFKFYSTTNGEIDHYGKQVDSESIRIRKIGAVLDYD